MVRYHTLLSLRELGRRAQFLDAQLERLDELIVPLVTARAPGLPACHGVGPDTAATLLIAAGDHPGRLRSEAACAHLSAPRRPSSRRPSLDHSELTCWAQPNKSLLSWPIPVMSGTKQTPPLTIPDIAR
jgi:hypothetical protein